MKIPPADVAFIAQRFDELGRTVQEAFDNANPPPEDSAAPALLLDAMQRLSGALASTGDAKAGPGAPAERELRALGEFGLHLVEDMAGVAAALDMESVQRELALLALPLAVWLAHNGAELTHLAPVVDAVASLANQSAAPREMAELYTCLCMVIDATAPGLTGQDDDKPLHGPWRLLILNRAIVATRSHRPELMEPALDAVVEFLPDEAARFLEEGMEQMEKLPYPEHVRELMQRYYLLHTPGRTLH